MAMDSLEADPTIARTLFHGLAFSKDITLPEMLKSTIDDHYFYSGRAIQSLMRAQLYIGDIDKRTMVQQQQVELYKKRLEDSKFE